MFSVIKNVWSHLMPATKSDYKKLADKLDKIMITEQQMVDALNKIDTATTSIAAGVQTEATVAQTISDEMDAFIAAAKAQGISQALLDQATALGTKAQASSDALTALVPVLQAIATKGVQNPVPVPVPTPAP